MHFAIDPFAAFAGLFREPSARCHPAAKLPAATDPVAIAKGEVAVVRDGAHAHVECLSGSLWITHDGDVRDIVISAGESHASDRPGPMLVCGLKDSFAIIG